MKHEAISKCSSEYSVVKMCKALELPQSGYYQWVKSEIKRQEKRVQEKDLIETVIKVFNENR